MSLIHEALKKAEEQRRLGQPPDLASPFARPRERQPMLPFLLVAIVIAAGAGWWLLRTPSTPTIDKSASTGAGTTPTTTSPQKAASRQEGGANDAGLERTAARSSSAERLPVAPPPPAPPPAALPVPNTGPVKMPPAAPPNAKLAGAQSAATPTGNPAAQGAEKAVAAGNRPGDAKPDPEALAQAMGKAAPVAANTTPLNTATKPADPAKVSKVPMPDTGPTLKPSTAPSTKTDAASAPAVPAPAIAASEPAPGAKKAELPDSEPVTGPLLSPPTAPTAVAADGSLPMFWQLSYPVRKELPQLSVSMHVYSADPGKRFIVINGDHKAEGDSIGPDLFVREIRSDGVVMEFRGQRFLVPRGGS